MKSEEREGGADVDMSPEAIEARLRDLGQIYRLGIALGSARRVGLREGGEAPPRKAEPPPRPTAPPAGGGA